MRDPKQYDVGDKVRVAVVIETPPTFFGPPEEVDPESVFLKFKDPAGEVTTWQFGQVDSGIVKETTGRYYADIDADLPGWWYYRWYSEGHKQAAVERSFRVKSSNFS